VLLVLVTGILLACAICYFFPCEIPLLLMILFTSSSMHGTKRLYEYKEHLLQRNQAFMHHLTAHLHSYDTVVLLCLQCIGSPFCEEIFCISPIYPLCIWFNYYVVCFSFYRTGVTLHMYCYHVGCSACIKIRNITIYEYIDSCRWGYVICDAAVIW